MFTGSMLKYLSLHNVCCISCNSDSLRFTDYIFTVILQGHPFSIMNWAIFTMVPANSLNTILRKVIMGPAVNEQLFGLAVDVLYSIKYQYIDSHIMTGVMHFAVILPAFMHSP